MSFPKKIFSGFLTFAFLMNSVVPASWAQSVAGLPAPGTVLSLTPAYSPVIVRGLMIHPEDSLKFDFIIDRGESHLDQDAFKKESNKLIKYFLASLTTPEKEMWVNLSPAEKNRIIPQSFGQTEMGRDLLAQDYMLKQLTASLLMPENGLGKTFWEKIYSDANAKFGVNEISQDTFNKIWIVPDTAQVYENDKGAFIVKTHLKVMLEEDYLVSRELYLVSRNKDVVKNRDTNDEIRDTLKTILIPAIEKEVNEGEIFANLRQIYYSMILASWYKKALKESLLGKVYADQHKLKGIDIEDKDEAQKIYNQYIEAFKKGVGETLKEEYDPQTQEVVSKKYITGGLVLNAQQNPANPAMFAQAVRAFGPTERVTYQFNEVLPKNNRIKKATDAASLADNGPRIPTNYVPITTQNLRDLTGLPGGIPLYLLESILRYSKDRIIANGVERAKNFIEQSKPTEFVFDLSDPVTPLLKPLAREIVVAALRQIDFKAKGITVTVRVNDEGKELEEDLNHVIATIPEKIDNVFIAVKNEEDVQYIDRRLKRIFRNKNMPMDSIRIMAFLSDPISYLNADKITGASDLINALMMSYTVAGDLGIRTKLDESLWDRDLLRLQRAQALVAVDEANKLRAQKGIESKIKLIDHVIILKMSDEEHLREVARKAKDSGADGIRALTPQQAKIFEEVFQEPSSISYEQKLINARNIIAQAKNENWPNPTGNGMVPPEALTYQYTSDDYDAFLEIAEKLQHSQLIGDGGIRYDPKGIDRRVDPYSARKLMLALSEANNSKKLTERQAKRFNRIEDLLGSYWKDKRLLQVPIEAVFDKARQDFHQVDSINFESAKVVRVFEEKEGGRGEHHELAEEVKQAVDEGIFFDKELAYAQKTEIEKLKIQRLAARLAAKKAVLNAFLSHPKFKKDVQELIKRIGERKILSLVEIQRDPKTDRNPTIILHGELLSILGETHQIYISITHDDGSGVGIAHIEEKSQKLRRYGIDLATKEDFFDIQDSEFIMSKIFSEDEMKWVHAKAGQDKERRAYYFAVIFAFKEAAYKSLGDHHLTWTDGQVTEEDGRYFITIEHERMPNPPQINLRILDFSSERSGRVYVVAESIFDPALQKPNGAPTVSPGSFRNRTKKRSVLFQHIKSGLTSGNFYIVSKDDSAYQKFDRIGKTHPDFQKASNLINMRGLDTLLVDIDLDKMDQMLKNADGSARIQALIGEFTPGFVAITLGLDEIKALGLDLPLSENARGVVLVNAGILDDPEYNDPRFGEENPDMSKIQYMKKGNELVITSEMINEAVHANNPSSPQDDDPVKWIAEFKEEAAGLLGQIENLIFSDDEVLKNAEYILSNKNDHLISKLGKGIIDTLSEKSIKWIFKYFGRVVLDEGYNSFPITLAKRFREGGDLQGEYSIEAGFSDKAIEEILKELKENDNDFRVLDLQSILESSITDVRAQYENLKQALEDPESVEGYVQPAPVPLTRDQRLAMMPRGDQLFNYSESKYLNYRSTLDIDVLDEASLELIQKSKADAVITGRIDIDLNKLGKDAPNILLRMPDNEEEWDKILDLIDRNTTKEPKIKALVIDPTDVLQLRELDKKLAKIEQLHAWLPGTIGFILRPTKDDHLKELLDHPKSTPRVVGVMTTPETKIQYAVAKAHNLAVIAEDDSDYDGKFKDQYEGVITKNAEHLESIRQSFTPTLELIGEKVAQADQLINQKSAIDISKMSPEELDAARKGKNLQINQLNQRIEEALWLPIFAMRIGLIDVKNNRELHDKIVKLRTDANYNPGMKRVIDYHGKENLPDLLKMFSDSHPNQKFIYVTGYKQNEAGEQVPQEIEIPVQSVWKEVNRLANYMIDQGIKKGDRVTLMMPNSIQFFAALMATLKIGAVAVNMEVGIKERQLTNGFKRSNVKAVFFGDSVRKDLDRISEGYFVIEKPEKNIQLSTRKEGEFITMDDFLTKAEYEELIRDHGDILKLEKGRPYLEKIPHLIQVDIDDVLPEAIHPKRTETLSPIAGVNVLDYREALAKGSEEDPIGVQVGLHDIAIEQYTSGSTSDPKRTAHTHETWMTAALSTSEFFEDRDGTETGLTVLPAVHVYGLNSMFFIPLVTGSNTFVLPQHPGREGEYAIAAARILLSGRVRRLYSVPRVLEGMTKYLSGLGLGNEELRKKLNLDLLVSRGSELSAETANYILNVLGLIAANGLGASESPNVLQQAWQAVEGTIGFPGPGAQMRLRDMNQDEEYSTTGPILPTLGSVGYVGFLTKASMYEFGYLDDGDGVGKAATAETVDEDGYIYPGDVVRIRWDGYVEYLNRAKDGWVDDDGNRIPIGQIEKAVSNLPGVLLSVNFGQKKGGHKINTQVIEMKPEAEGTLTEAQVINALRGQLAGFQVPKQVIFGKVVRSASGVGKPNRTATAKFYSGGSTEKKADVDNRAFDPQNAIGFMPEAGFDFEGMGKDLDQSHPQVRELLDRLNAVLQRLVEENDFMKAAFNGRSPDLRQIMWGDQKDLLTSNFVIKQIAMHAYQMMVAVVFEKKFGIPKYYAGKSMGISAALSAAGRFKSVEDGFRLTFEKSLYTSTTSTKASLRMGVISGLTEDQVKEAIKVQDGTIVIRQGDKNFIVSLKVDLTDPVRSNRFKKISDEVKRIDSNAQFMDSNLEMASHDPRLAPELHPEEWKRLTGFLNQLKERLVPVDQRKAKVLSSLKPGFVPDDAEGLIKYIEDEEFTPLEWKQLLQFANDTLGIRHFIQLAMKGNPFILADNQKNGIIDKEARITKIGFNEEFDLANKGVGQTFEGKAHTVAENDLTGYAFATGDWNFFHTNKKVASQTKYGGVIAHAPFTESYVLAALQDQFDGYTLSGSKVNVSHPVKPGDMIRPIFVIEKISGEKQEEITVITSAVNQNGEILFEGQATLKKQLAEGEDYSANRPTEEQAESNTDTVKATEPGEALDWKVGDKDQFEMTVTTEQYGQYKTLFSKKDMNADFKAKDLLIAKGLLSFASFSFVKGYVHVENEVNEILRPILPGDQFTLETEISNVSGSLVTFSVKAVNQRGETVFTGYVTKMKEKIELKEEKLTTDRPAFEREVRTVADRLKNSGTTQVFPGHNKEMAERAIADRAEQIVFDAEDASRPETFPELERVMQNIFSRVTTGTSESRFNIWRYFVKVGEKNFDKLSAALNSSAVITADDLGRAVGIDVPTDAKAALNKYLSTGGIPNWIYRDELIKLFDVIDFQKKLVFFRTASIRHAAEPMFALHMENVVGKIGQKLDGVILPKVDDAKDIREADRVLTALEIKNGGDANSWFVGRRLIQALMEKPEAIVHLKEIAKSSPRLASMIFGLVDYVAATRGRTQAHAFRYQLAPQRQMIEAAQEIGILMIGPITPELDASLAHRNALLASMFGENGLWAIHPSHVEGYSHVKFTEPEIEKMILRILSHKGKDQFAEGPYDLNELHKHAEDKSKILEPTLNLKRAREINYRNPVELKVQRLIERAKFIQGSEIEAVVLTDIDLNNIPVDFGAALHHLKAEGTNITVAINHEDVNENFIKNLIDASGNNMDAIQLTGSFQIDDVESLTKILNTLQAEGKSSINIHLNISTREQLEMLSQMTSVLSYPGESRVTAVIYDLPENPTESSYFKEALARYQQMPPEFFMRWDYEQKKFVPKLNIPKDPNRFFEYIQNGIESPREAARLDQMSALVSQASASGVNIIYRASDGSKADAYFDAMDAGNMGYQGMLINADHIEEQAKEVKRAMTPEKVLIDESLRGIRAYYNQAKILGKGAILFDFNYGYSKTFSGLVDEATNQMFIGILRRANELGLLDEAGKHILFSYGTERFFAEGELKGKLVDLREGENGWHYKEGDYTKVYKNSDETVVMNVFEKKISEDAAMTQTLTTQQASIHTIFEKFLLIREEKAGSADSVATAMALIVSSLPRQDLSRFGKEDLEDYLHFIQYEITRNDLISIVDLLEKFSVGRLTKDEINNHLATWLKPEAASTLVSIVEEQRKTADNATLSNPTAQDLGGIDLNPASLNMQIQRDGQGVPLPLNLQPVDNMNIEGFVPVIINIQPMTPAMLLSLAQTNQNELSSNDSEDILSHSLR